MGTVAEKSVEFADKAQKGIAEAQKKAEAQKREEERKKASRPQPQSYQEETHSKPTSTHSGLGNYELPVDTTLPNELLLKTPRGNVNVKGYNGDKITVKLSDRSAEFINLGCVYQVDFDDDSRGFDIDAFIPKNCWSRIRIESENGLLTVDGVESDKIAINTANVGINIKNVVSDDFSIDNLNGEVLLSTISGKKLVVENANEKISLTNVDVNYLKATTTSESIMLLNQYFTNYTDYNYSICTSNAKVKASLPVALNVGYKLNAFTSLSDISNGLSGLNYSQNDRNSIKGETADLSSKQITVNLDIETSNAPIYIN